MVEGRTLKIIHIILGAVLVIVFINAIIAGILFLIDTSGSKMGNSQSLPMLQ